MNNNGKVIKIGRKTGSATGKEYKIVRQTRSATGKDYIWEDRHGQHLERFKR